MSIGVDSFVWWVSARDQVARGTMCQDTEDVFLVNTNQHFAVSKRFCVDIDGCAEQVEGSLKTLSLRPVSDKLVKCEIGRL